MFAHLITPGEWGAKRGRSSCSKAVANGLDRGLPINLAWSPLVEGYAAGHTQSVHCCFSLSKKQ